MHKSTIFLLVLIVITILRLVFFVVDLQDTYTKLSSTDGIVWIRGIVKLDPQTERGRTKFKLNEVVLDGEKVAGTIYINSDLNKAIQRGDEVTIRGKAHKKQSWNDLRFYGRVEKIRKPEQPDFFLKLRDFLAKRIEGQLPKRTAGLGLAYLLGEKFMLDKKLTQDFSKAGLSHIIVASGFALSVLISMVASIFRNHSKFAMTSFSLLAMSMFVGFTGFTPSMTRAFLMTGLSTLVGHVGRSFRPMRLILLVICLSLLSEPSNLWSVGWQLSFSAFFGISVLAPALTKFFYGIDKVNPVVELFLASLSAQVCCLPISIFYFGGFSLAGIISNLILPPLLGITMLSVFLTGIFGGVIADWTEALLQFHILVVEFFAGQNWLQIW